MTENPEVADALAQLVEEHGLWEVHQALAALWREHDMVLDPPHVEHQASWTPTNLGAVGFAKETTFGTPITPMTYLPVSNPNTTLAASFQVGSPGTELEFAL